MREYHRMIRVTTILGLLVGSSACASGDDSPGGGGNGPHDGGASIDRGPRPDQAVDSAPAGPPCASPGALCTIDDPCVISAVCGDDFICRAESLQSCDDGIECTVDVCLGQGLCEHEPDFQACVIFVEEAGARQRRCFFAGEANPHNPCQRCLPATNRSAWTPVDPASEVRCDDGNLCTRDDRCSFGGQCAGTSYTCPELNLFCSGEVCDGQGGCGVRDGTCLIEGQCYAENAQFHVNDPCRVCIPSSSQTTWSVPSGTPGCIVQ